MINECKLESDVLLVNRTIAWRISVMAIIVCLVYKLVLAILDNQSYNDIATWDKKTCTASDYTIEIDFTEKLWDDYKTKYESQQETRPFDQFILEEFQDKVDQLNPVLQGNQNTTIAALSFGFKNGDIIKLLKKRGKYLTTLD